MPKVSVLVPVYNVEKYLSSCMQSIVNQEMEDIEIICVDDGSTDRSGEILDSYGRMDKRVKVLHTENGGYGVAMNTGLDAATGEYIGIVEGDDCILPDMYETLYAEASAGGLDIVKSDAYFWLEKAEYKRRIHYGHLEQYYDRILSDMDRNVFFDFFMNIWTGIYSRKFLLEYGIRFHESPGASYQDNGFWMQTLIHCRNAKWLSRAFYLYRQDNEMASVKSRDKMLAMTGEYEYLEKILHDRGYDRFLPYCYYYKLFRHRNNFYRIADENKRQFCEQIREDYSCYKSYIKGVTYLDRWLREAAAEPDELCKRVISRKRRVTERLENASQIIIYGAGNHGDIIFRGLYNEGYYDKISCFAVSQNPPGNLLAKRQVLEIKDALKKYPNALVIISVIRDSGMYNQMKEKLMELGKTEFLDGTSIEENFYIL